LRLSFDIQSVGKELPSGLLILWLDGETQFFDTERTGNTVRGFHVDPETVISSANIKAEQIISIVPADQLLMRDTDHVKGYDRVPVENRVPLFISLPCHPERMDPHDGGFGIASQVDADDFGIMEGLFETEPGHNILPAGNITFDHLPEIF
jgi:hypothetical protein